ncbi:hypothetical protein BABINDRAFT_161580 [Babjeviella inositovora NRRL Y-12698]|uniref:HIG1 domain-containing protein n=1 Tax=Babjeviella inositovora NRRL Y-12698 TaxID=984486 RepID=A0A1E3QQD9_9ASCO|nr:uncharacterized protein BABINDRAFT_161580 [Babjeviella inositovora NRRL Y-12698]ODQ79913.1 hypothetical protein BABINDRAFT_161580 [Babjeviella inositovora NRRL Y-12698]
MHKDPGTLKRLNEELIMSLFIGGCKGAAISIASSIFMRWRYPTFRNARFQVHLAWHVAWIGAASVWVAESHLIKFEEQVQREHLINRKKYLDQCAEEGRFIEE